MDCPAADVIEDAIAAACSGGRRWFDAAIEDFSDENIRRYFDDFVSPLCAGSPDDGHLAPVLNGKIEAWEYDGRRGMTEGLDWPLYVALLKAVLAKLHAGQSRPSEGAIWSRPGRPSRVSRGRRLW